MAQVAGIKYHKTPTGKLKSVTIDLKRHGDKIRPVLEQLGALEEDVFEKEWKQGEKVEESLKKLKEEIRSWNWEK